MLLILIINNMILLIKNHYLLKGFQIIPVNTGLQTNKKIIVWLSVPYINNI